MKRALLVLLALLAGTLATLGGSAAASATDRGRARLLPIVGCTLSFQFTGFSDHPDVILRFFREDDQTQIHEFRFHIINGETHNFDLSPYLTSEERDQGVEVSYKMGINGQIVKGQYLKLPLLCPGTTPPPPPPPPAQPVPGEPTFTG